MSLNTIQGWAHLCFLSPYQDGAFRLFRGHIIASDGSTHGIAGHYLPNHHDPNRNDCMDPILFYETVIKKYDTGSERRLLVRRVAEDDAAGICTDQDDDKENKGQSLSFETERFLVGNKAVEHCRKYLGQEEKDVVVCMGNMNITLKN
ncbi:hypothetical protein BJV82DRAFT_370691 [Fennellomyces sp. T-0311]|nr:hypothetical protein BJV82DRAFT_370691 [Fennellomyces sp. T-0311]